MTLFAYICKGTILLSLFFSLNSQVYSQLPSNVVPPTNQTTPNSSLTSRYDELEMTFQNKSAEIREPFYKNYLKELEKYMTNSSALARRREIIAVEAEIKHIKSLLERKNNLEPVINSDIKPLAIGNPDRTDPVAMPAVSGRGPGEEVGKLNTTKLESEATLILRGGMQSPDSAINFNNLRNWEAISLGKTEWQINNLPVGNYEATIIYALGGDPTDSKITIEIGNNNFNIPLSPDYLTGENNYRIIKLGKLTLTQPISRSTIFFNYIQGPNSKNLHLKVMYLSPSKE